MRTLGLCLALVGAVFLFGCGDTADEGSGETTDTGDAGTPEAGAGIPLVGERWDGSANFDATKRSKKVRVIAFFKPT